MKVYILFTIVAVISVRGQFPGLEYRLDSVPLPMRRILSNAWYEVRPSVSRQTKFQGTETSRVSNQGRRHIDNHHVSNIENGHNLRHDINDFGSKPNKKQNFEIIPQNHENHVRESNIQHINRNPGNPYYGEINPTIYDAKLKTNLQNTHSHQNIQDSSDQNIFSEQRNYPSNGYARTNENSTTQQRNLRKYENNGHNAPAKTNDNNRNFANTSPTQGSYIQQNYASNDNLRTSDNPTKSRTGDNNDNCRTSANSKHTGTPTQRAIGSNCENRQNVDSTRINNKNNEGNLGRKNTETRKDTGNKKNGNVQTTAPSRRIPIEDRLVTAGIKSTQDNELASRANPEGRTGTKDDETWIWSTGNEMSTKTTVKATLPAVDDRAAFVGDKCPNGQVRFNNMCVNKD